MEGLTQMELLHLEELMRAEEVAAKKAQHYADLCSDPELKKLLGSVADAHRQKLQGLMSKLETWGRGAQA